MSNYFIDISEHNTILSFSGMINSNLKGVIIKATEGTTWIDHALDVNYESLKGKIPVGFYHYLTYSSSPLTQAQNFWQQIKDKDYQILPVLDVEQEELGVNAELYSMQFIQEFFRLSGQQLLIYSGRCYIEEHFSDEFKRLNIWWVADYNANEPEIQGCRIVAWQYTEDCKSYAFTMGDLDCNILYDEDNFFIENFIPYSEPLKISEKDVATLQNDLIVQGYRDKNNNELIVDGVAGELTLSACPTLREGCIGNITRWVQMQIGVNDDGVFGEETRQAVITYQENMSLDGDGIVGKNTWRKLLQL